MVLAYTRVRGHSLNEKNPSPDARACENEGVRRCWLFSWISSHNLRLVWLGLLHAGRADLQVWAGFWVVFWRKSWGWRERESGAPCEQNSDLDFSVSTSSQTACQPVAGNACLRVENPDRSLASAQMPMCQGRSLQNLGLGPFGPLSI
jgi:hypothetical protein